MRRTLTILLVGLLFVLVLALSAMSMTLENQLPLSLWARLTDADKMEARKLIAKEYLENHNCEKALYEEQYGTEYVYFFLECKKFKV